MKRWDLVISLLISVTVHAALLVSTPVEKDAQINLQKGSTAITLHIRPSDDRRASKAAPAPKPQEPAVEPTPAVAKPAEKIDAATPRQPTPPSVKAPRPIVRNFRHEVSESMTRLKQETAAILAEWPRYMPILPIVAVVPPPGQPAVQPKPSPPVLSKPTPLAEPVPVEKPNIGHAERTVEESKASDGDTGTPGVQTEAKAVGQVNPVYPRYSRRHEEEGAVTILVEILASGKLGHVKVLRSSGYSRLDRAALDAVKKARFTPARKGNQPITTTRSISFTFRLTDTIP